jgi:hypothetical protein
MSYEEEDDALYSDFYIALYSGFYRVMRRRIHAI